MKIKRALISVFDKDGLLDLARGLREYGIEILSTGGTMKALKDAGIPVTSVSDVTGFPEILDGRVKTLHPKIHGGILARRDLPEHVATIQKHAIALIDLVVVNLYPFEKVAAKLGISDDEVIENIDIGGPSMVRSASKNFADVTIITSPADYAALLDELNTDMRCTNCEAENRDGAKFCIECATPLANRCPKCNAENPARGRGVALREEAPRLPQAGAARS